MYYKIEVSDKAENDLKRISDYLKDYGYNGEYIIKQINNDIERLNFMPRIHKTLISYKDEKGEYRRIVSGKYSIIYKIFENEITILRIFNQKENYLNQRNFILREKSQPYLIIKKKIRSIF